MRQSKAGSWWGLYALVPLTAILLVLAARAKTAEPVHAVLLLAIVAIIAIMAFLWSEGHADLMGSEGIDAEAEASELGAAGIEPGRYAPSMTALQARYRQVMFSHRSPETAEGRRSSKPKQ